MSAPTAPAATAAAKPAAVPAAGASVVPLLKKYLGRVVPAVLDCDGDAVAAALANPENDEALTAFATDSLAFSLLVHKHSVVPPATGDDVFTFELQAKRQTPAASASGSGSASPSAEAAPRQVQSLALIKNTPALDASASLAGQLQTVQINDATPFETILSYVRYCFLPYTRASASAASTAASDSSSSAAAADSAAAAGASSAAAPSSAAAESKADKERRELTRNVAKKLVELESELTRFSHAAEVQTCVLEPHKTLLGYLASLPAGARPAADAVPGQDDPALLNALHNDVNSWKRAIRAVTQQDRDPASGTAAQEVHFWLSKERAVDSVYDQLAQPGVQLAFDVLTANKRFMATSNFRADAGLADAKDRDRVHVFADYLRDLPVARITSSTAVPDLTTAIEACFQHLRLIRRVEFPPARALEVAHALSRDAAARIQALLLDEKVGGLPHDAFVKVVEPFFAVFTAFEGHADLFAKELQDIARKRGIAWDETLSTRARTYGTMTRLHKRLQRLLQLRQDHHKLLTVITSTLASEPLVQGEILRKMDDAVVVLRDTEAMLNVTDVTGNDAFAEAQQVYATRIDRVEADLEAKVHAFLARAQDDSAELFRVCERFNALFSRPRIGAAIRGYQDHLLATVRADLEELQSRFRSPRPLAEAVKLASLRDIPPVAAQVIWLKQLGRQLDTHLARVESILGPRWAQHPEGVKITKQTEHLRARVDTAAVFDDWVKAALAVRGSVSAEAESVFSLADPATAALTGAVANPSAVVTIDFDMRLVPLVKEARLLGKLVGRVPYDVVELTREAKAKHSAAMRLRDALAIYARTAEAARSNNKLTLLVAQAQRSVQTLLVDNARVRWDSGRLEAVVAAIAQRALEFEEQTRDLAVKIAQIDAFLLALKTQKPSLELFKNTLAGAQALVDAIDKALPAGYVNMVMWVDSLNEAFEAAFAARMRGVLRIWARALPKQCVDPSSYGPGEDDSDSDSDSDDAPDAASAAATNESDSSALTLFGERTAAAPKDALKKADMAFLAPLKHALEVRQQSFVVEPPLSYAVLKMRSELDRWLSLLADLPHLQCFAHTSMLDPRALAQRTFSSVFPHLAPADLALCTSAINAIAAKAESYTQQWLGFQALWDLDVAAVTNDLGSDIPRWERLLMDLRKSGGNIEGPAQVQFGPVVVQVDTIQTKIAGKFESVRKDFTGRLVAMLSGTLQALYNEVSAGRKQLEEMNFDLSTTAEVIRSITSLQELTEKLQSWQTQAEAGKRVETLIQRQRFVLPADWFPADRVLNELAQFVQVHAARLAKLREDSPKIQAKVADEELALDARVKAAHADWKAQRPVQADLDHAVVIHVLTVFDGRLSQLEESVAMLLAAKKALSMPPSSTLDEDMRLVAAIREEMSGLRAIWDILAVYWQAMDKVGEIKVKDAVILEIRREMSAILDKVNALPADLRSYSAYERTRTVVKERMGSHALIADCCTPFLRPKHQRQILKDIGFPQLQWADLSVGHLWTRDKDLVLKKVRAVLEQAQGEAALEEFINELSAKWAETAFETFEYQQGKCPLIRNWEQVFELVASNLSDLSAMKQSPFFPAFERDAGIWETFLNNTQALLDVFIEVQRRWVYLEGIFNNSTDVQTQLQAQYRKFKTFDRDFIQTMREVKAAPLVNRWATADKVLTERLERDLETLNMIQKALGEYLETQRQAFPRFYFVGDEDLLEIVGNAKNPAKIMRHLVKMFAGIAGLTMSEDGTTLTAMVSREGETVAFKRHIELKDHTSVQSLLSRVELEMRATLCLLLKDALGLTLGRGAEPNAYFAWIDQYPSQIALLATQVQWSELVDTTLENKASLAPVLTEIERRLLWLADRILLPDVKQDARRKYEQLITELVYQRDTVRLLIDDKVVSRTDFTWLSQPRFYFSKTFSAVGGVSTEAVMTALEVRMSRAVFHYGFEYLGITEKLVQTPLTTKAYLTLAEALHMRMGGNPFGPAGTGKTETVKALGGLLGRFVLVFNCDEAFDLQAMGRIFVGLCQCGAWGCFDEFNRLQERILSAVSQQILTIQTGLQEQSAEIALLGSQVKLHPQVGLFVTMNPGYAGRSNLPDNLKQLFRSLAMIQPNTVLISQVMLYAQGFRTAEALSSKIVLLFKLCNDQLSSQSHYDFGLRALKSVLRSAGALKRAALALTAAPASGDTDEAKTDSTAVSTATVGADQEEDELKLLVRALCTSLVPKLVQPDVVLFSTLLTAVFPTARVAPPSADALRRAVVNTATSLDYRLRPESAWVDKLLQLRQVLTMSHGVILVGPPGSGKSKGWNVLREAMQVVEGEKISAHVVDPKAISKEALFGKLDNTTMEWTDGVFTHLLRKILDNQHGEMSRQHWLVFDGDVDPEWAENLNSVLDDNKLLTLPNGERLALTDNIRLLFECQDLKHATPATVSRCGMVWFSEQVVPPLSLAWSSLADLAVGPIPGVPPAVAARWRPLRERAVKSAAPHLVNGYGMADLAALIEAHNSRGLAPSANPNASSNSNAAGASATAAAAAVNSDLNQDAPAEGSSFVLRALDWALQQHPIMDLSKQGFLRAFLSLLQGALAKLIDHSEANSTFPLTDGQIDEYIMRAVVFAAIWGFGGAMSLADRNVYVAELPQFATGMSASLPFPSAPGASLIDADNVLAPNGSSSWGSYQDRVIPPELDPQTLLNASHVIDTADTYKHTDVISSWIAARQSVLLCGPPGSGKSMTLSAVMRAQSNVELVTLNFSSTTTPQLLLRTLALSTTTERTPQGLVMKPSVRGQWLVIFCDEINLPAADKYDTQAVVTLMRQMIEHGGYWDPAELCFVKLENIQIIGACNPPTDAGRVALSPRFLRHCPLLFVDFPSPQSLEVIYGAFAKALLKLASPAVRQMHGPLTSAMVDVYLRAQKTYTPDQQAHYVYSPRELSRWVRALYEAFSGFHKQGVSGGVEDADSLVRLWAHEALRLFQDRLVTEEEREKMDDIINQVAYQHFPTISSAALKRPILYSDWLASTYAPVGQDELREYVKHRLKVFYEEELDVKLVLFDEVLEHILRIDRILKQPLGHALLVGTSGSGKTILSRFVAWMNNMQACQIKVHKNYTSTDFDKDLRAMLLRAGCKNTKICFIFDESNAVSTAFLERMNCLLASGEVPGLFEGPDYQALMQECREAARRDNWSAESQANEGELYKTFIGFVQRNLHVVFTMNPANDDFDNRAATSPALFNRCVIDWMGEWSSSALYQVGAEFTQNLDFAGCAAYANAAHAALTGTASSTEYNEADLREAVVQNLVHVHESVHKACKRLAKEQQGRTTYVTPRHYLDLISQYRRMFKSKQEQLREQQRHLTTGLRKLTETQEQVQEMQGMLRLKDVELQEKEKKANEQLEQMMAGRKEAEAKQKDAEALEAKIRDKAVAINARKAEVQSSLDKAMPAVLEAKSSVSGINKTDLDQVTRFANPPAMVKMTMEAVCAIMGEKSKEWNDLKAFMRKGDFIKAVTSYDIDALPLKVRQMIDKEYLPKPEFTFERVNQASKACGPLVQWVRSLITYAGIKDSIGPLTAELAALEAQQAELQTELANLRALQEQLNVRLEEYRAEYAALIGEAQAIKTAMEDTKKKVTRSVALLGNLGSERERWETDQKGYNGQLATVLGDCILAAGFLAYIGYFNQTYRSLLTSSWRECLARHRVPTSSETGAGKAGKDGKPAQGGFNIVDYMSTAKERLQWGANALPTDDLSMENGVILGNFHRYPLVIDPSGQATAFLMKQYAERKILRTSFLDNNFLKNLESALRFGNALLCEDVENIDPVLNPVLNQEITRTGGRVMVTVGDKAIDLSPSFVIFLATRNPLAHFTPDLCSRVTLVNFSVTPASLAAQCLTRALQAERPEVDRKRTELMRLQSEFRVRLRSLEDGLLDALTAVEGNILDDEKVITSLETLKKESGETQQKLQDSEKVMGELAEASEVFRPFANACSSIYFTLERLGNSHFLYQFSLSFFFAIVGRVLECPSFPAKATANGSPASSSSALTATMKAAGIDTRLLNARLLDSLPAEKPVHAANTADTARSIAQLVCPLVALTFARVSRALLNDTRAVVAMRLAQILLEALLPAQAVAAAGAAAGLGGDGDVVDFLLRGRLSAKTKERLATNASLTAAAATSVAAVRGVAGKLGINAVSLEGLEQLVALPAFAQLAGHMQANADRWTRFITPEAFAEEEAAKTAASGVDAAGSVDTEASVPAGWETGASSAGLSQLAAHTALCRALRPDAVPGLLRGMVSEVLGDGFMGLAAGVSSPEELEQLVTTEASAHIPILLVSQQGFDPSARVDALAGAKQRQLGPAAFSYTALAMGSPEGYDQADLAINQAAKKGHWVLLRNVHMAPEWLGLLEKRLHRMTPHASFRLFLSAELHPKLPSSLLRQSALVLYEAPKGVKASLLKTLSAGGVLTKARVEAAPAERGRLHFLLAWLHAVIVERRRYAPVGWLKPFEFSENDQVCAHAVVDGWVSDMAQGRHNVPPSQLPWPALRTVLSQVVYGGRVDNVFDGERLSALVSGVFTPQAYGHAFPLCSRTVNGVTTPLLTAPEGSTLEAFLAWAQALPDQLSPEVLGLPANAEKLLLVTAGAAMCSTMLELQDLEETPADSSSSASSSSEDADPTSPVAAASASSRPAWAIALETSAREWSAKLAAMTSGITLPPVLAAADSAADSGGSSADTTSAALSLKLQHPVFRCLYREWTLCRHLAAIVQRDLTRALSVLRGDSRADGAFTKDVLSALQVDQLPLPWRAFSGLKTLALSAVSPALFVTNVGARWVQLARLVSAFFGAESDPAAAAAALPPVWLGGLFAPEAFVAATRQAAAHSQKVSLESLRLVVTVSTTPVSLTAPAATGAAAAAGKFTFVGFVVHGAVLEPPQSAAATGTLRLGPNELDVPLDAVTFSWRVTAPGDAAADAADAKSGEALAIPAFMDGSRAIHVLTLPLRATAAAAKATVKEMWAQRSVCVTVADFFNVPAAFAEAAAVSK